ncbi:hypothetical protein DSO57_1036754 [Entomophthora muscae]|uniref:Uncharacterized protein n=1 Tax=Entomophthora muscae TaxID=34485 RepID=A0ACC2RDY3_9FUNG|nr:hypothetical protein DSO57_1036754 [Entomophthora muscae]
MEGGRQEVCVMLTFGAVLQAWADVVQVKIGYSREEKFHTLMGNTMICTENFGHTIPWNRKLMDTIVD